jgi:glutamate dehydrogenase/leucine dehydrogenase
MVVRLEHIAPEQIITPADMEAAEIAGVSRADHEELTATTIYHFDPFNLLGTDTPVQSMRGHTGPNGVYRGGTKIKDFSASEDVYQAMVATANQHTRPMEDKFAVMGQRAGGGKTIINVPIGASPEQEIHALQQVARMKVEAGLASPDIMATAGDERSNNYMGQYRQGFADAGAAYPDALVAGKDDFPARKFATGRGGVVGTRTLLQRQSMGEAGVVIAGMGGAGGHFAADAYDPYYSEDEDIRLFIPAVGDLDPKTGRPATLWTPSAEGLPITQDMMLSILYDKSDRDVLATLHKTPNGVSRVNRLPALARKIERTTGQEVQILDKDVLFYDNGRGNENVIGVPAATSGMVHPGNIKDIAIRRWVEVANTAFLVNVDYEPGEYINMGGAYQSTNETRRDLERYAAAEQDIPFVQKSEDYYHQDLRQVMVRATHQVQDVAEKYGISKPVAVRVLALAQMAILNDKAVDASIRDMITPALSNRLVPTA